MKNYYQYLYDTTNNIVVLDIDGTIIEHFKVPDDGFWTDREALGRSIAEGVPNTNVMKIVEHYVRNGYKTCFCTARCCETANISGVAEFFANHYPDTDFNFVEGECVAVNDEILHPDLFSMERNCDKKAEVLKDKCRRYDNVIFIDDNNKILGKCVELKRHYTNLRVIDAKTSKELF